MKDEFKKRSELSTQHSALAKGAESQNIEWKQSWHDEYLKWICGFANAQGGERMMRYEL